jgi:UDP-2,3-diacylglucosamine pyrophosphatase LpxH
MLWEEQNKKMVSVQIVSDLHIESIDNDDVNPLDFITPEAPILILAGDIGSFYRQKQLKNFLEKISNYFHIVLYIIGNHEYYYTPEYQHINFFNLKQRLFSIAKTIKNLHVLDRDSVLIGDVCIAGCTLWTNLDIKLPKFIVKIPDFSTEKYINNYFTDLEFITKISNYCKTKNYKLIVVTHHPPTYKVLENSNKNKKYISLYSNNLDKLLDKTLINTWICGHIHKNFDITSSMGTRIVSNQKGKCKDKINDFSKKFIINL